MAKAPQQFGKYELISKLGVGGMAVTWLARMRAEHGVVKPMVLKQVLPSRANDPLFVKEFLNEARISASLSHGNIAQVFDFGQVDGEYFMALEYVAGVDLDRLSQRAREAGFWHLPVPLAVQVMIKVLDALHYAHTRSGPEGPLGVVHRDVSPQNIVVGFDGQVKLIDFGVAKAQFSGRAETAPGLVKGKYHYFSPEQAQGLPLDARTDVFAAGVVLYELLAGRRPFQGSNVAANTALLRGEYPPLLALNPEAPPLVAQLIDRALSVEKEERFQTAAAFGNALSNWLHLNMPALTPQQLGGFVRNFFPDTAQEAGFLDSEPAGLPALLERWKPSPQRAGPVPAQEDRASSVATKDSPKVVRRAEPPASRLPLVLGAVGLCVGAGVVIGVLQHSSETPPAVVLPGPLPIDRPAVAPKPTPTVQPPEGAQAPASPTGRERFSLSEAVIRLDPAVHKLSVGPNQNATFTLAAKERLKTSSGASVGGHPPPAPFAAVLEEGGKLKGVQTISEAGVAGPLGVRLFDVALDAERFEPALLRGKTPVALTADELLRGVKSSPAWLQSLPESIYQVRLRGDPGGGLLLAAYHPNLGSVRRVLRVDEKLVLRLGGPVALAYVEGLSNGPVELLIGAVDTVVDEYEARAACDTRDALADKDPEGSRFANLTCRSLDVHLARKAADEARAQEDLKAEDAVAQASELVSNGKRAQAMDLLRDCMARYLQTCVCARAFMVMRRDVKDMGGPFEERAQACVRPKLPSQHEMPAGVTLPDAPPGTFGPNDQMIRNMMKQQQNGAAKRVNGSR